MRKITQNTSNSLIIIVILFLGIGTKIVAQIPNTPVEPFWQVSVGNHDHTSRDQLSHALNDHEGNLIIVGLVERDSTFGDIKVQKIDTLGNLVWQYTYSSNYSLNYDRPVDVLVGSDNSIYILGIVGNDHDIYGGEGYVFKLNKKGQLVWERKLYTELPYHLSISSLFFGFDSQETLHIAYTTDAFTKKPTYLFKITVNNVFIPIQTTPDIFNAGTEQPYLRSSSISPTGNKTFLIEKPNAGTYINSYYTQQITDSSSINYPIALSDTQQNLLQGGFDITAKDTEGNFYILGNKHQGSVQKGFSLFKILTTGQIAYSFYTTDSIEIEAKDMFVKDSSVFITGRFRSNNTSFWRVFVYKLDKSGQLIQKKFMPLGATDELAEGLYTSLNRLFLTINYPNGVLSVSELDSSFSKKWTSNLKNPSNQSYIHHSILALNDTKAVFVGTLIAKKIPENYFYSENDFYVESFNPSDTAKSTWTYRYSEIGTSYVLGVTTASNQNGDILAYYSEQVGPSYPALGSQYSVGSKSYMAIVNPSGQIIANKDVGLGGVSLKQFFTDRDSNFITIGSQINKIDKNGNVLLRSGYIGTNVTLLFVDTVLNQFYVSANVPQYAVIKMDKNFTPLSIIYTLSSNVKVFQLKNDITQTTYIYEANINNGTNFTISLYANEVLSWKKDTIFFYYNSYFGSDVNPVDGSFTFFLLGKIWKYALNGQLSSKSAVLETGDYPNSVFCMFNGNTVLTGDTNGRNLIQSYNTSLELVNRTILRHEFHIYYYKIGQFLIRSTDGKIAVFNANAEQLWTFTNDLFYLIKQENFDKNYNITVGTTIGQDFYLGSGSANEAYGWKWHRGVIAKFSLKRLLEPYLTASFEPIQAKNDLKIVAYPNPVDGILNLKISTPSNLKINDFYNIRIFNTLGQIVTNFVWKDMNLMPTVDFSNFKNGIYFLEVNNNDFSKNSEVIKIIKQD